MTAGLPRVYRMSVVLRVGAGLGMLAFTGFLGYGVWLRLSGGDRSSPLWQVMLAVVAVAALDWTFYNMFFRSCVVVTEDTLEIRNGRSVRRVPLAEIMDARPGPNGTAFVLLDGSSIGASALQKGLGAALLRIETRTDRAVGQILAAARACRGTGEPEHEPGAGRRARPATITRTYGRSMAVASLVLGIAGLAGSWIFGLDIVLAVLATVLGVFALDRANRGVAPGRRVALAGMVCGLVGLVLSIVLLIVLYEN